MAAFGDDFITSTEASKDVRIPLFTGLGHAIQQVLSFKAWPQAQLPPGRPPNLLIVPWLYLQWNPLKASIKVAELLNHSEIP